MSARKLRKIIGTAAVIAAAASAFGMAPAHAAVSTPAVTVKVLAVPPMIDPFPVGPALQRAVTR